MRNSLAQLRNERGISQVTLAKELSVSRQTIISIERGRFDPSLPLAFAIAQFFKRSIEEIFQPDEHCDELPER